MWSSAFRPEAICKNPNRTECCRCTGVRATSRLADGQQLMAHVPSHHDQKLGEWIGIRALVDHVVTFDRV